MHNEERLGIAAGAQSPEWDGVEEFRESPLWGQGWDGEAEAEEVCEQILAQRPGLQERQLWRALASYRRTGVPGSPMLAGVQLASADRGKIAQRVRLLIGRLPQESLKDFSGLVAFTETFLSRVQFVCDLAVYLFAEREKGLRAEGTEGRRYVRFFVEKLMWELDTASRIADRQPLSGLESEYLDWLVDRILDGEVLL